MPPVSSTTGKVSGPTPRQDNDCPALSASRPGTWTSRLAPAHAQVRRRRRRHRRGTASRAGRDSHGGWLACSVDEAARLIGLSRDLLYDQMRRGNLAYVKVGRRRLITRQHLQQFLGIAS